MVREGPAPLNEFLRIDTALLDATDRLRSASDSPRLDAELLLARALDVSRSYLFAHPEDLMDAGAIARFGKSVGQRLDGVPLAYLTGEKEFWSMALLVSRATLVPRPETELLVEQALQRIPRRAEMRVLDLGTGSGAIALAIARERPACTVIATDISAEALAVARENARRLLLGNVDFRCGDWLQAVSGECFELAVSNPPYIADDDPHLPALRHEPRRALAAGGDGLDAIRTLALATGSVLAPGGELLLEHGANQAEAVTALLSEAGWSGITTLQDAGGLPRVTTARHGAIGANR